MDTKEFFTKNLFKDYIYSTLVAMQMSQNKFAKLIGVSQATVNMWCTGKKIPSLKLFRKICEELNCDANYLLGLDFNTGGGIKIDLFAYTHVIARAHGGGRLLKRFYYCCCFQRQ